MKSIIPRMLELERRFGVGIEITTEDVQEETVFGKFAIPAIGYIGRSLRELADEGVLEQISRDVFRLYPDSRERFRRYQSRRFSKRHRQYTRAQKGL